MRIHYIIHAPFEKLGVIEDWIEKNNHIASGTHTYRGEPLPDVSQFDMLLIMGGPQSAVMIDDYPYLQHEVNLIKQAIQTKKVVLGICLGAQILGIALGAKATPSPNKEIGIYPIQMTKEAEKDPIFKHFTKQFDVVHWHSDMAGLPEGSILLASSDGCPRQAFRYGDRVYGLQFHLELTPTLMKEMIKHCHDDLIPGLYVQSADELLKLDFTASNQKMNSILDNLASHLGEVL